MVTSRYQRHRPLLGETGWETLTQLPVVIAGVGGLGTNVASILARLAPVTMELWDPGIIDEPDLNRQILYSPDKLGCKKCPAAAKALGTINPQLTIHYHEVALTVDTFLEHTAVGAVPDGEAQPFVLFDCLDSFSGRAELDEIRVRTGCTVFHGGVEGWFGQATTFLAGGPGYADAFGPDFAKTPKAAKPILPTTVSTVASIQVSDYLSFCVHGAPTPLTGTIAIYNGQRGTVEHLEYGY